MALSAISKYFAIVDFPVPQYPLITIKQTNVNTTKLGMSSEVHQATVDIEVRIWARTSKESDTLSAEVIQILRQNQYGVSGTDNEEIFGFKISSLNSMVETQGEKTIHSKIMALEYKAILTG